MKKKIPFLTMLLASLLLNSCRPDEDDPPIDPPAACDTAQLCGYYRVMESRGSCQSTEDVPGNIWWQRITYLRVELDGGVDKIKVHDIFNNSGTIRYSLSAGCYSRPMSHMGSQYDYDAITFTGDSIFMHYDNVSHYNGSRNTHHWFGKKIDAWLIPAPEERDPNH